MLLQAQAWYARVCSVDGRMQTALEELTLLHSGRPLAYLVMKRRGGR